jgi:hypothetical protein
MTDHLNSRYDIIECTVIGRTQYGLLVESIAGERGYVETEYINETPLPAGSEPKIGERIYGVVLGYTEDGRLRLSTQPGYVELLRTAVDAKKALDTWATLRRVDRDYAMAIEALTASPDMLGVLRWALKRRPSSDYDVAVRALLKTPSGLRLEFVDQLIQDITEGNHADAARAVIASMDARSVEPALRRSIEVLLSNSSGLNREQYVRLAEFLKDVSAAQTLHMVVLAMTRDTDPLIRSAGKRFQTSPKEPI